MSNLVMWGLIVGFLMPSVVSVLQRPTFSKPMRVGITSVVSIVCGAGTAYFNGEFNFRDIVGTILLVGVSAITFYKGVFKTTGISPAIERATSPKE